MEIEIQSVQDFIERVTLPNPRNRVFRGQSRDYPLLPSIFRLKQTDDVTKRFTGWREFGDFLVLKYINRAYPFLSIQFQHLGMNVDCGDHRLWALAQHYGLPTHLLDWSTDPMASLFFAVEKLDNGAQPSVVCELNGIQFLPANHNLNRENPSWPIEILQPPHFDSRIVAQSGCFSIFNMPEDWGKPLPLIENPGTKPDFQKYIIPTEYRMEIKKQLATIGYNREKVFPGLEGIAGGIKEDVELNTL